MQLKTTKSTKMRLKVCEKLMKSS